MKIPFKAESASSYRILYPCKFTSDKLILSRCYHQNKKKIIIMKIIKKKMKEKTSTLISRETKRISRIAI